MMREARFVLMFLNYLTTDQSDRLSGLSDVDCSLKCITSGSCVSYFYSPTRRSCYLSGRIYTSTTTLEPEVGATYYIYQSSNFCILRDWIRYEGHCYHVFPTRVNWYTANASCTELGAFLAEVETIEEDTFVKTLYKGFSFWLGATDLVQEGTFMWTRSGLPLNLAVWVPPQPRHEAGADCLEQWYPYNGWNDAVCTVSMHYLCEMSDGFDYTTVKN